MSSDWLLSLSIILLRFIQDVACQWSILLLLLSIWLCRYTIFCLPTNHFMDIYIVSRFWLLWIVLPWTLHVTSFVCKSLYGHMFSFILDSYLGLKWLRLNGSFTFYFYEKCQTVFWCDCTILHSYQQLLSSCIILHACQHLLLTILFIVAVLVGMKCYPILVLVCISLMNNDG